ncbi:YcgL domain-containing protein [Pseudohalioglobus lutimaris]|uniref:YcgL domain-containing protein C0039_08095 n=1 Tax=Pseudohalioglobus lutimaris TaxID=1737061 RepID=A0A2N5X4R1_9GAMM|nr:YcgL domain-containing protein [Pseudohalioglobus lutimaris]PLW69474.1 YcgL domain-containing protein [Pseudohalioglobus lutimaris]
MSTKLPARLIEVFSSSRKEEMYLYVDKAAGMEAVPEVLMKQFGEPRSVMTLLLEPERKLARVDTREVMAAIEDQGFFLQMPPTPAQLLRRNACSE